MQDPRIEVMTPAPEDADAIATVLYRASAAGYGAIAPAGFLWSLEETAESCRRLLSNPAATVLAAVAGDPPARQWLGVSAVLVPGDRADDAELRRLYVIPERWSQGVGSSLLGAALQSARRAGATTASLWVLENNMRARTFYEHRGWCLSDGTHVHDGVTEVRYRYALGCLPRQTMQGQLT